MSVINVKEDDSVRSESLSVDSHSAKRRFTVRMSSAADGPIAARRATGVPRKGDSHPDDPDLICTDLQTTDVGGSRFLYAVDVTYSIPQAGFSISESDNPLDQPSDIEWGYATSVEAIDQANDGVPIQNTVGETFDPPITDDIQDPVLLITRNEATFDINTLVTYRKAVNYDTFYGASRGEARMMDIAAQRVIVGTTVKYWKVKYTIQFRLYHPNVDPAYAWWKRILNMGYRKKVGVNTDGTCKWETILDKNEMPLNNPVALDVSGVPISCGADPLWLLFPTVRYVDFTPLGLE